MWVLCCVGLAFALGKYVGIVRDKVLLGTMLRCNVHLEHPLYAAASAEADA